MTSSRVLVRILIGLNVVLLLGYFAQVVLAVQSGSNPWAGLAIPWLAGVALIVFFVLVPLADMGVSAPLALFDLAAGWYLIIGRTPLGLALAACAVLGFAVGASLQWMTTADWLKQRRRGGSVSHDSGRDSS
jgi:hypothetical protein